LGFVWRGRLLRTASSVAGFSFAAHPAAFAMAVNFSAEANPFHLSGRLPLSIAIISIAIIRMRGNYWQRSSHCGQIARISCTKVVNVFSSRLQARHNFF
jgi:hypothetical protein